MSRPSSAGSRPGSAGRKGVAQGAPHNLRNSAISEDSVSKGSSQQSSHDNVFNIVNQGDMMPTVTEIEYFDPAQANWSNVPRVCVVALQKLFRLCQEGKDNRDRLQKNIDVQEMRREKLKTDLVSQIQENKDNVQEISVWVARKKMKKSLKSKGISWVEDETEGSADLGKGVEKSASARKTRQLRTSLTCIPQGKSSIVRSSDEEPPGPPMHRTISNPASGSATPSSKSRIALPSGSGDGSPRRSVARTLTPTAPGNAKSVSRASSFNVNATNANQLKRGTTFVPSDLGDREGSKENADHDSAGGLHSSRRRSSVNDADVAPGGDFTSSSDSDDARHRPTPGMTEEQQKKMDEMAEKIKSLELTLQPIAPQLNKRCNDLSKSITEQVDKVESKLKVVFSRLQEDLSEEGIRMMVWQRLLVALPCWLQSVGVIESPEAKDAKKFFEKLLISAEKQKEECEILREQMQKLEDLVEAYDDRLENLEGEILGMDGKGSDEDEDSEEKSQKSQDEELEDADWVLDEVRPTSSTRFQNVRASQLMQASSLTDGLFDQHDTSTSSQRAGRVNASVLGGISEGVDSEEFGARLDKSPLYGLSELDSEPGTGSEPIAEKTSDDAEGFSRTPTSNVRQSRQSTRNLGRKSTARDPAKRATLQIGSRKSYAGSQMEKQTEGSDEEKQPDSSGTPGKSFLKKPTLKKEESVKPPSFGPRPTVEFKEDEVVDVSLNFSSDKVGSLQDVRNRELMKAGMQQEESTNFQSFQGGFTSIPSERQSELHDEFDPELQGLPNFQTGSNSSRPSTFGGVPSSRRKSLANKDPAKDFTRRASQMTFEVESWDHQYAKRRSSVKVPTLPRQIFPQVEKELKEVWAALEKCRDGHQSLEARFNDIETSILELHADVASEIEDLGGHLDSFDTILQENQDRLDQFGFELKAEHDLHEQRHFEMALDAFRDEYARIVKNIESNFEKNSQKLAAIFPRAMEQKDIVRDYNISEARYFALETRIACCEDELAMDEQKSGQAGKKDRSQSPGPPRSRSRSPERTGGPAPKIPELSPNIPWDSSRPAKKIAAWDKSSNAPIQASASQPGSRSSSRPVSAANARPASAAKSRPASATGRFAAAAVKVGSSNKTPGPAGTQTPSHPIKIPGPAGIPTGGLLFAQTPWPPPG